MIGLESATAALSATAKYLHGKDLRSGGSVPAFVASLLKAANHIASSALVFIWKRRYMQHPKML